MGQEYQAQGVVRTGLRRVLCEKEKREKGEIYQNRGIQDFCTNKAQIQDKNRKTGQTPPKTGKTRHVWTLVYILPHVYMNKFLCVFGLILHNVSKNL